MSFMVRLSNFSYNENNWAPLEELSFSIPTLQAHRGYWVKGQPQNTLGSIQAAVDQKFQMIELDLRLTLDQQIVLFHDPIILDTDTSYKISETSYENLKAIAPITTLPEVFNMAHHDLILNLEVKNESRLQYGLEEKLIAFFKAHPQFQKRVLFSSFNPVSLSWMAQLLPQIPRALLVSQEKGVPLLAREMTFFKLAKPHLLHVRWEDLDHYKDIPFNRKVVWTVNDVQMAQKLLQNNRVRSVITDEILPQQIKTM
jgi:glycerophosphoryl diester phosphodiesterase